MTIARTEATSALNCGHYAVLQELDASELIVGREWLAIGDDDTRETHLAAHGQVAAKWQPSLWASLSVAIRATFYFRLRSGFGVDCGLSVCFRFRLTAFFTLPPLFFFCQAACLFFLPPSFSPLSFWLLAIHPTASPHPR